MRTSVIPYMRYSLGSLVLVASAGVSHAQPRPPVGPDSGSPAAPSAAPAAPSAAPAAPAAPAASTVDPAAAAAAAAPALPAARAPYGKGPSATASYVPPPPLPRREPSEHDDAHATSNFIAPTAIMPPAGSKALHSYEILLTGFSYSPTATTAVSFTSFLPIMVAGAFIGQGSIKTQIVNRSWLRVALHGSALTAIGSDLNALVFATAGAVGTACFDCACGSHASVFVAVPMSSTDELDHSMPVIFSGGLVLGFAERLKFLFELDGGGLLGSDTGDRPVIAIAGIRYASPSFGLDVGLSRALHGDPLSRGERDKSDPLPLVNLSYRY